MRKPWKQTVQAILLAISSLVMSHAFAASDELVSNLFQDLKNYMGLMQGDEREYQNRLRAVPPPYYAVSATSGNAIVAAENTQGMTELQNFLMSRLIDWNMLQTSQEVSNSRLVEQHLLGFCSQEESAANFCDVGLTISEGGAADLLVDTLLNNETLTENQQLSVWAFIDNLTNPSPIPLPDNTFTSEGFTNAAKATLDGSPMAEIHDSVKVRPLSAEGVRTLAARYKQMAFLSTAQNALNQIAADRHVIKGLGQEMGMDAPDASIFAAMKFESNRRFGDENWHNEMYQAPEAALLREIANMQAFQLALDFKRYEQDLVLTTLLAAQVSSNAQGLAAGEMAATVNVPQ